MADRLEMFGEDRTFVIAFGVSLGLHLLFLLDALLPMTWLEKLRESGPLSVVYDFEASTPEARALQAQFSRAQRDAVAAPAPGTFGERMQVRIPDRPQLAPDQRLLEEHLPSPSAVIDLTDLVDASRGNPVLLTYFSAIREQIQRTANLPDWQIDETRGGLVYISFVLGASGDVSSVSVVAERSIPSRQLQEVALRIVRSSAPFPPFPPSIEEPRKTIVVPLEFLAGS